MSNNVRPFHTLLPSLCWAFCVCCFAAVVIFHPRAVLTPILVVLTVMICRRKDWAGGFLYITFLAIAATGIYAFSSLLLLILPVDYDSIPILLSMLILLKEWQRFLDNEYGEGIIYRRVLFAFLGIVLATAQVLFILT